MNNQRIIFLRTPRCGSASLSNWCLENGIRDIYGGREMGFWGSRSKVDSLKNIVKSLKKENLSERVAKKLGSQAYYSAFKFTSVRNPYSRAVSIWRHQSWSRYQSFAYFCEALYKKQYPSQVAKWHAMVISDHIFIDGKLKVDKVLKLESIEKDIAALCNNFSRPFSMYSNKPIDNSRRNNIDLAGVNGYAQLYTKELAEIIFHVYQKDFDAFGYSPVYS